MFHGSCRKVAKVLSLSLEPISESTVYYLAKKASSTVRLASEPKHMRWIAVDGTRL
ncbi:MAG: hypothetical protein QXN77_08735 [Candidatus Caldarchaeum sp.]